MDLFKLVLIIIGQLAIQSNCRVIYPFDSSELNLNQEKENDTRNARDFLSDRDSFPSRETRTTICSTHSGCRSYEFCSCEATCRNLFNSCNFKKRRDLMSILTDAMEELEEVDKEADELAENSRSLLQRAGCISINEEPRGHRCRHHSECGCNRHCSCHGFCTYTCRR